MPYIDGEPQAGTVNVSTDLIPICQGSTGTAGTGIVRTVTPQQLGAAIGGGGGGSSSLTVTDGSHTVSNTTSIQFAGSNAASVSVSGSGNSAIVTVSATGGGGGGSSGVNFSDGTNSIAGVTSLTFQGASAHLTGSSGGAVISLSGGGSSSGIGLSDGTHSLSGVTNLTVSGGGAVVGGSPSAATLTLSGTGGGFTLKDGTTTLTGVTQLTVAGGIVGGTASAATLGVNTPPAFEINAAPSISYAPPNDTATTLSSLLVQANSATGTTRQFLASLGFVSNNGIGTSGYYNVTLYRAMQGLSQSGNVINGYSNTQLASGFPGGNNAYDTQISFTNKTANYGAASGPAGMALPNAAGLNVTGASTFSSTSGIVVGGSASTQWYRGVTVYGGVSQASFADYGSGTTGYQMIGSHSGYGIDMLGSVVAGAIRIPNNNDISARNGANNGDVSLIRCAASNQVEIAASGASIIYAGNTVSPLSDNAYNLGQPTNRWVAVYASNGTIQTSDPRLKTDVKSLPDSLPLVAALKPITFRWKSGGHDIEEVEETRMVHATEEHEIDDYHVEMRDGSPVRIPYKRKYTSEIWDHVPLLNPDGSVAVEHIPAQDEIRDKDGNVLQEGSEAFSRPLTHPVKRMVPQKVKVQKKVEREGRRTHWGFDAENIKEVFDTTGLDFGGYVEDEGGTKHIRPDQLIPVLVKAVQELAAEVQLLKDKAAA